MKNSFINVLLLSILISCISYAESGILGKMPIPTVIPPISDIVQEVTNQTSTPGILWFYDDDGNLVKPTLEVPPLSEIEATTVDDKVIFTLYTNEKPEAYLKKSGYNIIVVDWSKISLRPYGWAASHVKKVGQYVAKMIEFLETQGMDLNKLKLVGHSLGAQIMGSAGYHAKNKVNYIVGLDPALPLFYNSLPGSRISTHDAKNVEIIHTNGGLLGILVPSGHVDFYPNGGQKQVGCLADPGGACSYSRSYQLYAESITSDKGFYGKPCNNYLKMAFGKCSGEPYLMGGLKNLIEKQGTYFLETNEATPFAMGMN